MSKLVTLLTWRPVAEGLPDPETNVLLGLADGTSCEGFLDAEPSRNVWRDVCADELDDGAVVYWAELPACPSNPAASLAFDAVQTDAYAEGRKDEAEEQSKNGADRG